MSTSLAARHRGRPQRHQCPTSTTFHTSFSWLNVPYTLTYVSPQEFDYCATVTFSQTPVSCAFLALAIIAARILCEIKFITPNTIPCTYLGHNFPHFLHGLLYLVGGSLYGDTRLVRCVVGCVLGLTDNGDVLAQGAQHQQLLLYESGPPRRYVD